MHGDQLGSMNMYRKTTDDITVEVMPVYLEEHSDPDEPRYMWAYKVVIANGSKRTIQLLNRYWRITDAHGRIREIRGAGVVGEQPVLSPGEAFEYSSWTPLDTPSGFMVGQYQMQAEDGDLFDLDIPAFALDLPDNLNTRH